MNVLFLHFALVFSVYFSSDGHSASVLLFQSLHVPIPFPLCLLIETSHHAFDFFHSVILPALDISEFSDDSIRDPGGVNLGEKQHRKFLPWSVSIYQPPSQSAVMESIPHSPSSQHAGLKLESTGAPIRDQREYELEKARYQLFQGEISIERKKKRELSRMKSPS